MQFKSNNKQGQGTGMSGFNARSQAAAPAAKKKVSGRALYRVKTKGDDGKWVTLGSLFENTDTETGDVFYSLSVPEGASISAGIHRVFDATTAPKAAGAKV